MLLDWNPFFNISIVPVCNSLDFKHDLGLQVSNNVVANRQFFIIDTSSSLYSTFSLWCHHKKKFNNYVSNKQKVFKCKKKFNIPDKQRIDFS